MELDSIELEHGLYARLRSRLWGYAPRGLHSLTFRGQVLELRDGEHASRRHWSCVASVARQPGSIVLQLREPWWGHTRFIVSEQALGAEKYAWIAAATARVWHPSPGGRFAWVVDSHEIAFDVWLNGGSLHHLSESAPLLVVPSGWSFDHIEWLSDKQLSLKGRRFPDQRLLHVTIDVSYRVAAMERSGAQLTMGELERWLADPSERPSAGRSWRYQLSLAHE